MTDIAYYESPIGKLLLSADGTGLTGLWFEGQKYYGAGITENPAFRENAHICDAADWLDSYFSGLIPKNTPKLHMQGTEFRTSVWKLLLEIPYGKTTTYGELAAKLAAVNNSGRISARAAGGAVGHNPISIIVPCHRVIGADGTLTGYAGGIERKEYLLRLEKII